MIGECGKFLVGFGVVSVVDTVAIGHSGGIVSPSVGTWTVTVTVTASMSAAHPALGEGAFSLTLKVYIASAPDCGVANLMDVSAKVPVTCVPLGEPVAECQRRVREWRTVRIGHTFCGDR